ncbi:MAG: 1,4-alpha-glucan branching protein GlgB [bacterium]|nr:MAG: 1,4-alpha-glucan branching protein GlgB [bacterium]
MADGRKRAGRSAGAGQGDRRNAGQGSGPGGQGTVLGPTLWTEQDVWLFKEGNHYRLYERLGSHAMEVEGVEGTYFSVWAPAATAVSVIGDFNRWDPQSHPLGVRWDGSGIWEGFLPGVMRGSLYKYHIISRHSVRPKEKGDPFALHWETPPKSASVVWDLRYRWTDGQWMGTRRERNKPDSPISIYEVHLGSWKRAERDGNRSLSYREIAPLLAEYVLDLGFTHVEFLPLTEHPFYGSWGYQVTGYFAPSSRYGTPQDFMFLVNHLHRRGIGVILDWVPSHFPTDGHGLARFDGTHVYEHSDPRKGYHPDWKSAIFNFGRNEVRNFLISSALFWLENYHIDGLRVDAVASMLYLDYSRKEGEWVPNRYGGRENLDAMDFIRRLNQVVYGEYPDVQTIAEESTAWPMVTRPTYSGGLGFGLKWNMGWMHDTLKYFSHDPVFRKYHHDRLTFSMWYAFSENFLLPLSHDEVVHGKGSLLGKMPGDEWQRFANLRLLFGYMYMHPGKKLLFMGGEFGQEGEWDHDGGLSWHLLDREGHRGVQTWTRDLNVLYRSEAALYRKDFSPEGFEWIDTSDHEDSVISFLRRGDSPHDVLVAICNFTPVPREDYRVGIPFSGHWREVLNSDSRTYGGSGVGNWGQVRSTDTACHGRERSLVLTLPPLGVLILKPDGGNR